MNLRDRIWAAQDRWDEFMEDPRKTHLLTFACGIVIGGYLGYLL